MAFVDKQAEWEDRTKRRQQDLRSFRDYTRTYLVPMGALDQVPARGTAVVLDDVEGDEALTTPRVLSNPVVQPPNNGKHSVTITFRQARAY